MEIQDTSPRQGDIRREVYQNKHSQRQRSFDEWLLLSIVSRKLLARRNEEMVVEIHSQHHLKRETLEADTSKRQYSSIRSVNIRAALILVIFDEILGRGNGEVALEIRAECSFPGILR